MREYLKSDATWYKLGFINFILILVFASEPFLDSYKVIGMYLLLVINLGLVTFIPDKRLGYCYLIVIFGGSTFRPIHRISQHYGKSSYNYKWWGIPLVIYVVISLIAVILYPFFLLLV